MRGKARRGTEKGREGEAERQSEEREKGREREAERQSEERDREREGGRG